MQIPRAMHSLCTVDCRLVACGGTGVSTADEYMMVLKLSPDSCGSDIRHLLAAAECKIADLVENMCTMKQEVHDMICGQKDMKVGFMYFLVTVICRQPLLQLLL